MSKLMWIAGIVFAVAGVVLGVLPFVAAAPPAGVSLDTAVILLVGGILCLGLGSVLNLLEAQRRLLGDRPPLTAGAGPAAPIPEFGRKQSEPAAAPAAAAAASQDEEEVSAPTRDTLKALEQARQKIEQAFDAKSAPASESAAAAKPGVEETSSAPAEEAEEPELVEGQLYVVEERVIRMRPARILSDGTVEAETDEGWMRFENLEHLDEYLDAMEPAKS